MIEKLRFTGDWPPLEVVKQCPNWVYALDEEDVDGQDETTTRAEDQQTVISGDTAYTAARARQADGTDRMAIVALVAGRIAAVDVYINEQDKWRIGWNRTEWIPFVQTWLPENERMQVVSLDNTTIFPLRVTTVLPVEGTELPLEAQIK